MLLQSQRKALKEQLKALEAQVRQQARDEGNIFAQFRRHLHSLYADLVHFCSSYVNPVLPSTAQRRRAVLVLLLLAAVAVLKLSRGVLWRALPLWLKLAAQRLLAGGGSNTSGSGSL